MRLRTLYLLCYPLSLNCTGCVLFLKSTVCSCVHDLLYTYVHKCLRMYVRMYVLVPYDSILECLTGHPVQMHCSRYHSHLPYILCTLCCLNCAHHYSRSCPQASTYVCTYICSLVTHTVPYPLNPCSNWSRSWPTADRKAVSVWPK